MKRKKLKSIKKKNNKKAINHKAAKNKFSMIFSKKTLGISLKSATVFFTLIGVLSSFATLESYINDDHKAESLFLKAKDYYYDKEYDRAIKVAKEAYNINPDIRDLKYYYTLSLLKSDKNDKFALSKAVYMGNLLSSNASELAILGYIYYNDKEYGKAIEVFNKIEDPLQVNEEIYPIYINSLVDSTYKNFPYDEALNRVNKYMIQISRKYNSEESSMISEMEFLYNTRGVEIKAEDIVGRNPEALETIKYSNLILNHLAFNYAMENQDLINLDNILANGARGFDVFIYQNVELNKDFLFQFNSYIASYNGFEEQHLNNIKVTFDKTINALERAKGSTEYNYESELRKLYLLNNIFVDTNNLDWPKYNINFEGNQKINVHLSEKIDNNFTEGSIFKSMIITNLGELEYGLLKGWSMYEIEFKKRIYKKTENFNFKNRTKKVPLFFERNLS